MKNRRHFDTEIMTLGVANITSPIKARETEGGTRRFVSDKERILVNIVEGDMMEAPKGRKKLLSFQRAGPRSKIFFDPSKLHCAVVSCGGLCPGINDIIRSIVLALHYHYGVRNIYGISVRTPGFHILVWS